MLVFHELLPSFCRASRPRYHRRRTCQSYFRHLGLRAASRHDHSSDVTPTTHARAAVRPPSSSWRAFRTNCLILHKRPTLGICPPKRLDSSNRNHEHQLSPHHASSFAVPRRTTDDGADPSAAQHIVARRFRHSKFSRYFCWQQKASRFRFGCVPPCRIRVHHHQQQVLPRDSSRDGQK